MKKERQPLLRRRRAVSGCFKNSLYCPISKGALLVLLWAIIILLAFYTLLYSFMSLPLTSIHYIIWDGENAITFFIFFPLFGYLGERIPRYRLLAVGVTLIIISYIVDLPLTIVISSLQLHPNVSFYIYVVYVIAMLPALMGYGLVITNIIQFGVAQLQFAPSGHFAAFARWSTCVFFATVALPQIIIFSVLATNDNLYKYSLPTMQGVIVIFLSILTFITKRHFVFEFPSRIDAVKQIWQVLKHAWKHKHPTRTVSAFAYTHNNALTRMDICKERYGGPFTLDEVEDVKTFWYIFFILFPHIFIPYFSIDTFGQWYFFQLNSPTDSLHILLLKTPSAMYGLLAAIFVAIFQLVIVPFFPRIIPNMLKRILIGICCHILSAISTTVIYYNTKENFNNTQFGPNSSNVDFSNDKVWPYYIIAVPIFLTGMALFLNVTSQLEFILAQSPHNMRGMLISFLQCELIFPLLIHLVVTSTHVDNYWQYYIVETLLCCASLVICSFAAYFYRYRQRNDISDINVRATIEEIYERDLNRTETDD